MNRKILMVLVLGMFMFSMVSADYKFQDASGTDLVRIYDSGNMSVVGNVSAANFFGSGKYLTDIDTSALNVSGINFWEKNGANELYYNTANVGIGTNDPAYPFEVKDTNSIYVNPATKEIGTSANDLKLTANGQNVFRGLDGWTGTWADAAVTTYFQVGRSSGSTMFSSLNGAAFGRLAFGVKDGANEGFLIQDGSASLVPPKGFFEIRNNALTRLIVKNDGDVGIGTDSPAYKLDVNGTTRIGGSVGIGAAPGADKLLVQGQDVGFYSGTSSQSLYVGRNAGERLRTQISDTTVKFELQQDADSNAVHSMLFDIVSTSTAEKSYVFSTAGAEALRINQTGVTTTGQIDSTGVITGSDVCTDGVCLSDVANGNTNASDSDTLDGYDASFFMPLNKSVYGDFDFNGGWTGGGVSIIEGNLYAQSGYFYDINSLSVTNLVVNGSLIPDLDNMFDVGNSTMRWRDGYFGGNLAAGNNLYVGAVGDMMRLDTDGNGGYLNYNGGIRAIDFDENTTSFNEGDLFIDATGNVGIGTIAPGSLLHIKRAARDANILIESENADAWNLGVYDFLNDDSDDFYISGPGASSNGFVIKQNTGNVGIGTIAPGAKLDIRGDLIVTGKMTIGNSEISTLANGDVNVW